MAIWFVCGADCRPIAAGSRSSPVVFADQVLNRTERVPGAESPSRAGDQAASSSSMSPWTSSAACSTPQGVDDACTSGRNDDDVGVLGRAGLELETQLHCDSTLE